MSFALGSTTPTSHAAIHFRDVSDRYYAYSVDEERLQRKVLGQRVLFLVP